jgi:hypothetical protein
MFEVTTINTLLCTWVLRCAIVSTIHAGLSVADDPTSRWSTGRLSEGRYDISATSLSLQNLAFFAGGIITGGISPGPRGMILVGESGALLTFLKGSSFDCSHFRCC